MKRIIPEQLPFLFEQEDRLKEAATRPEKPEELYATQYIPEVGYVLLDYSANHMDAESERKKVTDILLHSPICSERNLETIDVGTAFYGSYIEEDGSFEEPQRYIVTDSNFGYMYEGETSFISKDSELGKAVMGQKGEKMVDVEVLDRDRKIENKFYIHAIDTDLSHYINLFNSNERTK